MALQLPDNIGQLTVTFSPSISFETKLPRAQVVLTTLVVARSAETPSVLAALDTAHAWDVRAFREFMSPQLQETWKRRDAQ
jgi:hypothetical protein